LHKTLIDDGIQHWARSRPTFNIFGQCSIIPWLTILLLIKPREICSAIPVEPVLPRKRASFLANISSWMATVWLWMYKVFHEKLAWASLSTGRRI
jgi:hypothetical protein